jgi:copper(I)-binding protein
MRTAVIGLLVLVAACSAPPKLGVGDAWVRLPAVPGRPAAAYFTLHGGPTDTTLIAVTTDVAIRSEMHESMARGMVPLPSVPVPATQDVAFQPGGRHVMLFNVNPGIKPGGRWIRLTFTFADGRRIQQNAVAVGAGDPAPK